MDLGLRNRLTQLRRGHGLSQEEFAQKAGVDLQTVDRWENGQQAPTTDQLFDIARVYEISVNSLIGSPSEPSAPEEKQRPAALSTFPFPCLCLLVFLLLGVAFQGWGWAWVLFLTVPLFDWFAARYDRKRGLAVRRSPVVSVVLPVACVALYLVLLFALHLPSLYAWLVFVVFPVFYTVQAYSALKKAEKKDKK